MFLCHLPPGTCQFDYGSFELAGAPRVSPPRATENKDTRYGGGHYN
jgi:hypothetical protein